MYLPLMLNLSKEKVVIIGGGAVGLKKAQKIYQYGGNLTIVALSFVEGFDQLKGVEMIQAPYEKAQISGAGLVVAATSESVLNERIYDDCKTLHILCNVVDNAGLSDVIFPASRRQGDLTISVSTGGSSPLLAKEILREVGKLYDEKTEKRLKYIGEIRKHILATEKDPVKKQLKLEEILKMTTLDLKSYVDEIRREQKS